MRNIINEITVEQTDIFLRWEMIKMTVRGYSIQFGTRKKRSREQKLLLLEKKLADIETSQSEKINLFHDYNRQAALVRERYK